MTIRRTRDEEDDARAASTRGGGDEDDDSPSAKRARADDDDDDDAREREKEEEEEVPLYMCLGQLKCARGGCVPCRRAVFAAAGARNAPNARPETCPRYARDAREVSVKRMGLYRSGRRRLLTVGDGDFSFSLALARAFGGDGVVATSYETRESLESVYGESCARTLEALAETGATVAHGVDASALDETLPEKCRGEKYDCVVWNFPCVARAADGTATEAALNGFDARSAEELEANRALVESFVSGASSYLVPEKERFTSRTRSACSAIGPSPKPRRRAEVQSSRVRARWCSIACRIRRTSREKPWWRKVFQSRTRARSCSRIPRMGRRRRWIRRPSS